MCLTMAGFRDQGPASRSRRWVVVTWVVIAAVVAGFLVVHLLTGGMGRH